MSDAQPLPGRPGSRIGHDLEATTGDPGLWTPPPEPSRGRVGSRSAWSSGQPPRIVQNRTPTLPRLVLLVRDHRGMVAMARQRRTRATFYGQDHVRLRRLAVAAYRVGDPCAIGGEPLMVAAEWLDLAHDHVNGGYLGLACRFHNRSEAASRGNRQRGPLPRSQRRAIAYKVGRWR